MANPNNYAYGVGKKCLPTLPTSEGIIDPSNEQLGLLILETVAQVNAHRSGPRSPWVWKDAAERFWADGEHTLKGKYIPWSEDARKAGYLKSRVLKLISYYSTLDMPYPRRIKLLAQKLGTKMEEHKACFKRHQSAGPKPLLGHGVTCPTAQNVPLEYHLEAASRFLAPVYLTEPRVAAKAVTKAEEVKAAAVRGAGGGRLKRNATNVDTATGDPSYKENNGQQPRYKKGNTGTNTALKSAVNRSNQPSIPPVLFNPLLEQISLTVTAVSLTPISGNGVVRHIRKKVDEVITRFLPCVDFLVNCQQELRQGLAVAQQQPQQQLMDEQLRDNAVLTPRQFHILYIAPLPYRFKLRYEPLMTQEHLRHAVSSLESLVRDSAVAVPQGNNHVKNAFLGGMRENQSWGLRKWLSEHGGAGSICNDVEEVMRHVKALKKEEKTTKRLAEMLRPIARQAHDRLKKDVPAAYQEKSKAHPYLPFFHRLEFCLKQMATYDPGQVDEDVSVLSISSSAMLGQSKGKSKEPEIFCLIDSDNDDEEDGQENAFGKDSVIIL